MSRAASPALSAALVRLNLLLVSYAWLEGLRRCCLGFTTRRLCLIVSLSVAINAAFFAAASMFNNFALDYPILAGVGLGAFIIFLFGFCFWFLIEGETGIAAATDDGDDGQTVDDKTKKLEKKYQ